MTTIAYKDGVMAADSGSWFSGACAPWAMKLSQGPDGTLYGAAGNAAQCEAFHKWVRTGCHGEAPKPDITGDLESSFIVLAAEVDGPIRLITAHGAESYYYAPYFAIGAGAAVAMGAMFAGGDAETAVRAVLTHGDGAAGAVRTLRHPAGE
tara:strand:- start:5390 stop:5842 length:453 start_codon:yes stop_codon:yes gene_type:complete